MYLQKHPDINKKHPFDPYGCKIISYFYFAEQIRRKHFTAEQIEILTDELIAKGYLAEDMSVFEKYEKLLPVYLGIPVIKAKREDPFYRPKDNEIGILRLQKPKYQHFVPGFYAPGHGWGYSWDSLGVRPGRDKYKIIGIRIMELDTASLNFPLSVLNPLLL